MTVLPTLVCTPNTQLSKEDNCGTSLESVRKECMKTWTQIVKDAYICNLYAHICNCNSYELHIKIGKWYFMHYTNKIHQYFSINVVWYNNLRIINCLWIFFVKIKRSVLNTLSSNHRFSKANENSKSGFSNLRSTVFKLQGIALICYQNVIKWSTKRNDMLQITIKASCLRHLSFRRTRILAFRKH